MSKGLANLTFGLFLKIKIARGKCATGGNQLMPFLVSSYEYVPSLRSPGSRVCPKFWVGSEHIYRRSIAGECGVVLID